jgi:hypothetical protein
MFSQFLLFEVIMLYKVTKITELMNSEALLPEETQG